MNDACELAFSITAEQRFQHLRMQTMKTRWGQRVFYRSSRELVPKTYRAVIQQQHSRAGTFFECFSGGIEARVEQPQFSLRRHHRNELDYRASGRSQPCESREHGVAHRYRHAWSLTGECLRHEEGIARGNGVKIINPFARALREFL